MRAATTAGAWWLADHARKMFYLVTPTELALTDADPFPRYLVTTGPLMFTLFIVLEALVQWAKAPGTRSSSSSSSSPREKLKRGDGDGDGATAGEASSGESTPGDADGKVPSSYDLTETSASFLSGLLMQVCGGAGDFVALQLSVSTYQFVYT